MIEFLMGGLVGGAAVLLFEAIFKGDSPRLQHQQANVGDTRARCGAPFVDGVSLVVTCPHCMAAYRRWWETLN